VQLVFTNTIIVIEFPMSGTDYVTFGDVQNFHPTPSIIVATTMLDGAEWSFSKTRKKLTKFQTHLNRYNIPPTSWLLQRSLSYSLRAGKTRLKGGQREIL
jgi:hypothetical protein